MLADVLPFPTLYPRSKFLHFIIYMSSDYFLSYGGARVREIWEGRWIVIRADFFLSAIRTRLAAPNYLKCSNVARIINRIMDKSDKVKASFFGFSLSPTMWLDRSISIIRSYRVSREVSLELVHLRRCGQEGRKEGREKGEREREAGGLQGMKMIGGQEAEVHP